MKIIISPAKKMRKNTDAIMWESEPILLEETKVLKSWLASLSYEELKSLWKCSDNIAEVNFQRIQHMQLDRNRTAALLAYEGIQYQYMAPEVFSDDAWTYVQEHLRILSGFYGVLRPLDGIVPYRLEMQAKPGPGGCADLYAYWGKKICDTLIKDEECILNLASAEYAKCISRYLPDTVRMVTCIFAEEKNGKYVQAGTMAKMARGEMTRYLAENQIQKLEEIKQFGGLDFCFAPEKSSDKELIFLRQSEKIALT